jgi:DNA polymerase-4
MWGVGPVAAESLRRVGIRTFGDMQRHAESEMRTLLGDAAGDWWKRSFGIDDRPVIVERTAKSVGHEQTFGEDLRDRAEVEAALLEECDDIAARLRRKGLRAKRVTVTRSRTLDIETDRSDLLRQTARELFRAWADGEFRPVRLIGCSASELSSGGEQLALFGEGIATKHAAIDRVADAIQARFGKHAIARADLPRERAARWTDREAPRGH